MWPSCGHPMPLMSRIAPMSAKPRLQRLYQLLGMVQGIKILKAQRFGLQEVKVGCRRQWSIKPIHDLQEIESYWIIGGDCRMSISLSMTWCHWWRDTVHVCWISWFICLENGFHHKIAPGLRSAACTCQGCTVAGRNKKWSLFFFAY